MAIGKRINASTTTAGRPDVHGATQEQVEVGGDLGRPGLGLDRIAEILLRGTPIHPELVEDTDELITYSRMAKEISEWCEAFRKNTGEEIMSRMCQDGETEHATSDGQWVCQLLVGRTGAKLSETRLLERGVSADVIAESREGGKEYTYVQIKRPASSK